MKNYLRTNIRWMIRDDMNEVLAIEKQAFEFPWQHDDFVRCLRLRNAVGMTAEYDDAVLGFMVYELHKDRLHILNFAVHEKYRRNGIGQQMVAKLTGKLSAARRNRIMLEVRETNLAALNFFKACGFKAVSVLKDFYEDTTEDAFLMQYRHQGKNKIVVPTNRIAEFFVK